MMTAEAVETAALQFNALSAYQFPSGASRPLVIKNVQIVDLLKPFTGIKWLLALSRWLQERRDEHRKASRQPTRGVSRRRGMREDSHGQEVPEDERALLRSGPLFHHPSLDLHSTTTWQQ